MVNQAGYKDSRYAAPQTDASGTARIWGSSLKNNGNRIDYIFVNGADVKDYRVAEKKLRVFYEKFQKSWFTENKPTGFDVQDIRLGGLMQRLSACRVRLEKYLAGKEESIPELEEKLLEVLGKGHNPDGNTFGWNWWTETATANIL